jgi:6-pyruvoyltetrahydropterin/6-carboxytetrahydropterin synthase
MKTTVSKRMTFCAGHRLYNPEWSEEKNQSVFGPCSNPNGHGHNYVLEVQVTGPVDAATGMIINLKSMKQVIQQEIIDKLDHQNLNSDVDFLKGVIPTTENLAAVIWEILDSKFGGEMLSRIILWESENNHVEICR